MSSDRGPHFVAEVIKNVSKTLRSQFSRQVERMNQILKRQISKICQEAQLKWIEAVPLALLRSAKS